jgi:hypothetical protein
MRVCNRNDFKNVGAAEIYDKNYETNEEIGYLICADSLKDTYILHNKVKDQEEEEG